MGTFENQVNEEENKIKLPTAIRKEIANFKINLYCGSAFALLNMSALRVSRLLRVEYLQRLPAICS